MADIKPQLITLFQQFDSSGRMKVSAHEFQIILQRLGVDTRPSVTQRIVALLDMDEDGSISAYHLLSFLVLINRGLKPVYSDPIRLQKNSFQKTSKDPKE